MLPDEDAQGLIGLTWFAGSLALIIFAGGLLAPTINSLLIDAAPDYAAGGLLGISSGLNKAVEILAPLVLGITLWLFGWTIPFLIEGVIILILLFITTRRFKPVSNQAG
jgi:hypothetical protein